MAIITKPRGQQKERNLQPPMFPHYFLIMARLWKHLVTPGWPQLCKVPSGHIMNVHLFWQSERQETADGWDNREAKVGSSVIALLFRKRMCLTRTTKKKKLYQVKGKTHLVQDADSDRTERTQETHMVCGPQTLPSSSVCRSHLPEAGMVAMF